ncbi:MAG: PadR family transcriptional regulator [Actinomycetes bacterium]|jgi:DNA-binding PadR family transcriptional regulator|nr:PadR family transcriptional regulator [Actinomycetes bacterium]
MPTGSQENARTDTDQGERTGKVSLEHAILGFLNEAPSTGYDLKRRCFAGSVSAYWTADQAQIYRTLERLADRSLVTERRTRGERRPDRRVYSITRAGRDSLMEWLATPEPVTKTRDPFALKLRFSYALPRVKRSQIIRAQLDEQRSQLERLQLQARHIADDPQLTQAQRAAGLDALAGVVGQHEGLVRQLEEQLARLEGRGT